MNRKQFTILLVLVVVLGGISLVILNKQREGRKSGEAGLGRKLMGDFPVNDVAHIRVKGAAGELNLVKKDDLWRVQERNGYPANFNSISELLLKMRDLKVLQAEPAGASQLPRLQLAEGQGTNSPLVVDFKDKADKSIRTLLLGKKQMSKSKQPSPMGGMGEDPGFANGRYVKMAGANEVISISDALDSVEPRPEQWLDREFVKVEKAKTLTVTFAEATNSWSMSREAEGGEWKLADAKADEKLDSGKLSALASPLASLSFSDVETTAAPEALGLSKPVDLKVETFDGFVYAFKVGTKTNENYPLMVAVSATLAKDRVPGKDEKPEDKERLDKEHKDKVTKLEEKLAQEKAYEKWTYLLSAWSLDSVLNERSHWLAEKEKEPAPAAGTEEPKPPAPNP